MSFRAAVSPAWGRRFDAPKFSPGNGYDLPCQSSQHDREGIRQGYGLCPQGYTFTNNVFRGNFASTGLKFCNWTINATDGALADACYSFGL